MELTLSAFAQAWLIGAMVTGATLALDRWWRREDLRWAQSIRDSMGPVRTQRQVFWQDKVFPVISVIFRLTVWPMTFLQLLWFGAQDRRMWLRRWWWTRHSFKPTVRDLVTTVSEEEAAADFYFLNPKDEDYERRRSSMASSWDDFRTKKPSGAELWRFSADRINAIPTPPTNDRVVRTGYAWVVDKDLPVWSIHSTTPYASGKRKWWR